LKSVNFSSTISRWF